MRAALITGREQLEYKEFEQPDQAAPGAVVVSIVKCGICGSDVSAFRGGYPYPPFLSGHEWMGTVWSVGQGVEGLAPGDRVLAGVPPACGHCAMCRGGFSGRCEHIMALPMGAHPLTPPHGGYTDRISVPADTLLHVPDAISDEQAAMVEPATVALHAIRRTPPRLGETVVVLGAGPVGLFAVQLLGLAGAAHVFVVEPRARRCDLATELGAQAAFANAEEAKATVTAVTGGRGADIVFDCAGNEAALNAAVDLCRPGGTVMMVGVASGAVTAVPGMWLGKELTINTSLGHLNHEFEIMLDLIASGRVITGPLHDRTTGLDELPEMFVELADGADFVKVLFDPSV